MFKIYEENILIDETTSGVLCAMYQAFRDNGLSVEDSLNTSKSLHSYWIKLDYPIDINKLVDYICFNKINLNDFDYKEMMIDFNKWIAAY